MDKTKLQNILALVDKNNAAFPENDYLDICKSLMDIYDEETIPENHVVIPLEDQKDNFYPTMFRMYGSEDLFASMDLINTRSKDLLDKSQKMKENQKEISRYPLKRITSRIQKAVRIQLCEKHFIFYDYDDIPSINKINLVSGESYDIKSECENYMSNWNEEAEDYIRRSKQLESIFQVKLFTIKKYTKFLIERIKSIEKNKKCTYPVKLNGLNL